MMDSCSDPGENQFFDALEEIAVVSDSGSDYLDDGGNCACDSTLFDVWIENPESVKARRSKFFSWLGFDVNKMSGDGSEESCDLERKVERIRKDNGAVLSSKGFDFEFSSSRSSISCCSSDDTGFSGNLVPEVNLEHQSKGVGVQNKESGSDVSGDTQQPECSSSSSSSGGEFMAVKNSCRSCSFGSTKRVKKWWLSRVKSFNCVAERRDESSVCDSSLGVRIQRVKVHQSKEISALYYGQSIQAHKGAILTMKFSPDGQFLASAGKDRTVRVWQVIEDDRSNGRDIPDLDPSSVYFTMNHLLELKPLSTNKEKNGRLKINSDSACVVLPPKVFRLSEKPLHEFQGHTSEILDLSWSKSNYLLSSSVDKTVRLWQVGDDCCLKVFAHNDYVTCVQFNPLDENYFISGSIDGKVRIWRVSQCKVIYWTEIKAIVTAVCYCPDGLGGIIGSVTGSCRFFSISENQLQLDAQISVNNKKKSSGRRITGFQFSPQDASKVMISCADSQVRIVQGVDVIGRYEGIRSTGTYGSALFTSDGKHIVSASEDSNVYVWKYTDQGYRDSSHVKKVKSSERFVSNASVALPWPGLQNKGRENRWPKSAVNGLVRGTWPYFSPAHFSCGKDFVEGLFYPKGSALWPEEKLLASKKTSSMHRSEYKFLRVCQSRSDSHAWGMVIVTAGWDGRIRSFHNYGLPVPH